MAFPQATKPVKFEPGLHSSSKMTAGDCGFNYCAAATRFNLQVAAELLNSFSHPCYADADLFSRPGYYGWA